MLSVCLLVWCGLLISALPSLGLYGAGSLDLDDVLGRGEVMQRSDAGHQGKPPNGGSLDERLAAIEGLVSGLKSRIDDLEKRNRDLELAVMIERSQTEENENLQQLVEQLERGLTYLFPDFKEESKEATRHLNSDEKTTKERMMALRDYLGNREATFAELRPDRVLGLHGSDDTTPPDLETIGVALQQLSKENADMRMKMDQIAQQVSIDCAETKRSDDGDGMENTVRQALTEVEDMFLDEAERGRAADTRKSVFSVASSRPQMGQQFHEQHVSFHDVLSNKGGDFMLSNNSFICRIPGFYYFTFTMRTYDHHFLGVVLMKNDDVQVSISTDQSDRSISSSQSVILRLSAGDNVWLRMPPSENYAIYSDGSRYTTFSGFLVFSTST